MSLASSRFTTMSSAGDVGLKLLSTSTVPLMALIFAITSWEMRSSSLMSEPCAKMRIGRFQPMFTSRPAMRFRRLRNRSSSCFWLRECFEASGMLKPKMRVCFGMSWISNQAELRHTLLDRRLISLNSRSAASTCSALEVV